MAYAAQQDLVTRFGERELIELTDRADPPSGVIDAGVVAAALADTDGEINGYLTRLYSLPLPAVPELIVNVACDIARYRLFEHRTTDQVERRYDAAIETLEAIAKGELKLQLPGGAMLATDETVLLEGDDRLFTRNRLKGF